MCGFHQMESVAIIVKHKPKQFCTWLCMAACIFFFYIHNIKCNQKMTRSSLFLSFSLLHHVFCSALLFVFLFSFPSQVHPDKNKHPRAGEAFKVLRAAWDIVSNPETRREYEL